VGALLCIRHAESTMNAAGLWQGQADPPLSPKGRIQARRLADELVGAGLVALVSSDLARARETAEILGATLGLAVERWPELREMDVGAWSGLSHEEIARCWPEDYARFGGGCPDVRPGGGESRRELHARVTRALTEAAARWPGERVAVVTHRGALRALAPELAFGNAEARWLAASRAIRGADRDVRCIEELVP
jgi:glucosyl-3-phosphoglycerate phosphatase